MPFKVVEALPKSVLFKDENQAYIRLDIHSDHTDGLEAIKQFEVGKEFELKLESVQDEEEVEEEQEQDHPEEKDDEGKPKKVKVKVKVKRKKARK